MGVTVRQKQPGRGNPYWIFINHQGKRKSKLIGDQKTAEAVAVKIREKLKLGELNIEEEKKVPLFKEYALEWFETHVKPFCKHSTLRGYKVCLHKHILPFLGTTPLDRVLRRDVKQLISFKLSQGLSPGTVRNIKTCLSGIFASALDDELVIHNPVTRLGKQVTRMLKKGDLRHQIDPFTREEVKLFLDTAKSYCPRYFPLFMLALRTGMRQGEILGLEPGDIDFHNRRIRVQRALDQGRVTTPKNGKVRLVDMSEQLEVVLQGWLVWRKEEKLEKGWKESPRWLFYNDEGKALDPSNLRKRYFYKCLEKTELRQIRFHDLRHTYATLLILQGESLAYIKEQLGHHSIQVTVDIYGHLAPGTNRSAVDKLDDIINKTAPVRTLSAPRDVSGTKKAPNGSLSA